MGRQKWGYSKEDGAEDFDRNECTCTWAHFLYGSDVWVEVTVLGTVDHPDIASRVVIRPRGVGKPAGSGYWLPEAPSRNTVKFKIPYSPDGLRFSIEFGWEILCLFGRSRSQGCLVVKAAHRHKGQEVA